MPPLSSDLKRVSFTLNGTQYTMKEMLGAQDLYYENEYTDRDGKLNLERLTFRRLNLTIESPPFTEDVYQRLTRAEITALIGQWATLNKSNPVDFLDTEKPKNPT